MNKFHIALSVNSIADSVVDYTQRLGKTPDIVISEQYALWRTSTLNFSIRQEPEKAGLLRHLGWEDENASFFSASSDVNGIVWETFSVGQQENEIKNLWPNAN